MDQIAQNLVGLELEWTFVSVPFLGRQIPLVPVPVTEVLQLEADSFCERQKPLDCLLLRLGASYTMHKNSLWWLAYGMLSPYTLYKDRLTFSLSQLQLTSYMKRKTPLKRRKGINKVNAARRSKRFSKHYHSEAYVITIKAMACLVCKTTPCHAHHVVTRAAGGTFKDLVPLCVRHHKELHDSGVHTFSKKYDGVDLTAAAKRVYHLMSPLRGDQK